MAHHSPSHDFTEASSRASTEDSVKDFKQVEKSGAVLPHRPGNLNRKSISRLALSPRFSDLWACIKPDDSDEEDVSTMRSAEEDARRSREIDEYLQTEFKNATRCFKTVLVGSDLKGYFWKQARLSVKPMTKEEQIKVRIDARKAVARMVQHSLNWAHDKLKQDTGVSRRTDELTDALKQLDDLQTTIDTEAERGAEIIKKIRLEIDLFDELLQQQGSSFKEVTREALHIRYFYVTCKCAPSERLADDLERVFSPTYEPTEHDWLHFEGERYTGGLREVKIERECYFIQLLEVNTRMHRKIWKFISNEAECMIFAVSLATYDTPLFEDKTCSLLREEESLFGSIATSRYFKSAQVILVLADALLFKNMLSSKPLARLFHDYTGGDDYDKALEFVRGRFEKAASGREGLNIHIADTLNQQDVQLVLNTIDKSFQKVEAVQPSHMDIT